MNKYFLFCAIALGTAFSVVAQIKWLETKHNFGAIDENNGKVSCSMRFVNQGADDVVIESVRPTCGCTATDYPKNAIVPGDTAAIVLTYNPYGRPGKFSKDAYVVTNSTPRRMKLTIEGNVIGSDKTVSNIYPYEVGNLKLNRLIVPFGEVKKGKLPMQLIKGYNRSIDSVVVHMPNLPSHIKVETIPPKIGPGDLFTISLYYDSNKQSEWGFLKTELKITATNLKTHVVSYANIEILATVLEDFSNITLEQRASAPHAVLSSNSIVLSQFSKKKTEKASFSIKNNGKSPLIIRKIYWIDKAITVNPISTTIAPGKNADFKIEIDGKKVEDKAYISKINILTNDPDNSTMSVRIAGELIN